MKNHTQSKIWDIICQQSNVKKQIWRMFMLMWLHAILQLAQAQIVYGFIYLKNSTLKWGQNHTGILDSGGHILNQLTFLSHFQWSTFCIIKSWVSVAWSWATSMSRVGVPLQKRSNSWESDRVCNVGKELAYLSPFTLLKICLHRPIVLHTRFFLQQLSAGGENNNSMVKEVIHFVLFL